MLGRAAILALIPSIVLAAPTIRFELDGSVLPLPLSVQTEGGEVRSLDAPGGSIGLEASAPIVRLHTSSGWIWIDTQGTEEIVLRESPCCGLEWSGWNPLPHTECPPGPCPDGSEAGDPACPCPEGTQPLRPALASDPECGSIGRCLRLPYLRLSAELPAASAATGEPLVGEGFLALDVAGAATLQIGAEETQRHRLFLAPGAHYVLEVGPDGRPNLQRLPSATD